MPRTKTITDEELLAGAMRALIALGPRRFTLAAAAAETGLAPATLLQRYRTKDRLVRAALLQDNRAFRAEVEALPRKPDAEALVRFLTNLARGFGDRAMTADNIALLSEDIRDPELGAMASERTELMREAIRRMLPKATLPVARAAELVEAQWHGAVVQAALAGKEDIPAAVERGLRTLLRVLLVSAGERKRRPIGPGGTR